MVESELNNGRLAMIAFIGMYPNISFLVEHLWINVHVEPYPYTSISLSFLLPIYYSPLVGMLVQEYFTAVPAISSLADFFIGG